MEPTCDIDQSNGKHWRLKGKLHREDGPAFEGGDGRTKGWWVNGKLHRIDGPAMDMVTLKKWFLNGEEYAADEWKVEVRKYYDTDEDYLLMLLKLD